MTQLIDRLQDVQPAYHISDDELASVLIASGGDLRLVAETANLNKPYNAPSITEAYILQAFIKQASSATTNVHESIRALMLLNFLEILIEAKAQLKNDLPDASFHEVLNTVKTIIEGMAAMMPAAAPPTTQVNLLQQFGADAARERVVARLETYQKVEAEYPQTVEQVND